jgi:hypothetical protein
MEQLFQFTQGIRLLVGILTLVLVLGGGIFLAWTGMKILAFRRLQRQGAMEDRARKFDEKGQARPPRAPGVCDCCGRVFGEVNFLVGNERVCDGCLKKRSQSAISQQG